MLCAYTGRRCRLRQGVAPEAQPLGRPKQWLVRIVVITSACLVEYKGSIPLRVAKNYCW